MDEQVDAGLTEAGVPASTTFLARLSIGARVHVAMGTLVELKQGAAPNVCQRKVVRTNPKGLKTECLFADGTRILLTNFLGSLVHATDELVFPLSLEAVDSPTEIYIRHNSEQGLPGLFQAEIGYAEQPRRDKWGNLLVSTEVYHPHLGVSKIILPCESLRDYFYVANRRQKWDRQPTFYELLRVSPRASPTELRLAFKLRTLEYRAAHASVGDLHVLERAFNTLAHPELRSCYEALLNDPGSPALFPYSGFGSLLVAGKLSRDGSTFYASRVLSFLREQNVKQFQVPMRNLEFHKDHAVYRDSRRKLEILFDQASLALQWDSSWNQWKHLLGTKIGVKGAFIQGGKYRRRGDAWDLVSWLTALPSRLNVELPADIGDKISQARETYHYFGQFADVFDGIRARIESTPMERNELQRLCSESGVPGNFDVAIITWRPDYNDFYYEQLRKRARHVYLFRSEYIFDLETAVVVETPQLGHATYMFSRPASLSDFLAIYKSVTKDDVRQNRHNVAERLGFMGRMVHEHNLRAWICELKRRLGEPVNDPEALD